MTEKLLKNLFDSSLDSKDELDYLTRIAQICEEKGYDYKQYASPNLDDEDCEICKLQNFVFNIALIDDEILDLVHAYDKQFWKDSVNCPSEFRAMLNDRLMAHQNLENSFQIIL